MLREFQTQFAARLLTPAGAEGRTAIYRANVLNALTGVLAAAYPRCRERAGAARFDAAACDFIAQAPPRAPQLFAYGAGFARFLAEAADWHDAPHLADLARLEWARLEAYFAPDAAPLAPATLKSIPEDRYAALRFTLHPAARLLTLRHAVSRIWERAAPAAAPLSSGETLLVVRPHGVVSHGVLSPADGALIAALAAGANLERAAERAFALAPSLDLQGALHDHLQRGTFSAVS